MLQYDESFCLREEISADKHANDSVLFSGAVGVISRDAFVFFKRWSLKAQLNPSFAITMAEFSVIEYYRMLQLYFQNGENGREAARLFNADVNRRNAERGPNARQERTIDKNVVYRLINRVRTSGTLVPIRKGNGCGAPRSARTDRNNERILREVHRDPKTSSRAIARTFGLSHTTVQRTLRDARMHAYHPVRVQALRPGDYAARVEFCRWIQARHRVDEDFVEGIIFTDESHFGRNTTWNCHNYHVYARQNPHIAVPNRRHQERFSVNLWAGIKGSKLVSQGFHS